MKTTEWALAAFDGRENMRDLSFSASAGNFAQANFNLSVLKEGQIIDHRSGPTDRSASGSNVTRRSLDTALKTQKNQCVFISYYKMQNRLMPQLRARQRGKDAWGVPGDRFIAPSLRRFLVRGVLRMASEG